MEMEFRNSISDVCVCMAVTFFAIEVIRVYIYIYIYVGGTFRVYLVAGLVFVVFLLFLLLKYCVSMCYRTVFSNITTTKTTTTATKCTLKDPLTWRETDL